MLSRDGGMSAYGTAFAVSESLGLDVETPRPPRTRRREVDLLSAESESALGKDDVDVDVEVEACVARLLRPVERVSPMDVATLLAQIEALQVSDICFQITNLLCFLSHHRNL